MSAKIIHLPGDEINGIKFVREVGKKIDRSGYVARMVVAICPTCEMEFTVSLYSLRGSRTTQCYACGRIATGIKNTTHGKCHSVEYHTLNLMKDRCYNPKAKGWENYGLRGIKMCDRWLEPMPQRFLNFLEDMGECPPGRSIDRIDNNGDYSPENCRWATAVQQAGNRSDNTWITHDGRAQILTDWAREVGIKRETIARRLRLGWSVEEALTIRPVLGRNRH